MITIEQLRAQAASLLGHHVRDQITGFEGIATSYQEQDSGVIRVGIIPKVKEAGDSIADGHNIDVQTVESLSGAPVLTVIATQDTNPIQLGMRVRDRYSLYEGVAWTRDTFMNGCVYYNVVGQSRNGKPPQSEFMSSNRLEVVPPKRTTDMPVADALVSPPRRTATGGPNDRVPSARAPRV